MTATPAAAGDHVGPLLLRLRHQRGQSQQRLADALCAAAGVNTVSRHEISRWERGERIPTPFWLGWLSEVLGVPVAQLELATARSRDQRASGVTVVGRPSATRDAAVVAAWPWRLIRACRVVDAAGRVTVRLSRPVPAEWVDGAAMGG
jgi:transcriptional regulator with XRE-family HTH domain